MLCSVTSLAEASGPCSAESYGLWRPYMASVLRNQRITAPDHFQDTRHIELDLGGSGIAYDPGDLLTIFPRQPSAAVQEFMQCNGLDGSVWVEVTPCEVPPGMAQRPSMQVDLQRPLLCLTPFHECFQPLPASMHCFEVPNAWLSPCLH